MIEDALFLGVVQIVVYTGAVMMLFLFVLMLIGVDSAESLVETLRGQRVAALLAGLGIRASCSSPEWATLPPSDYSRTDDRPMPAATSRVWRR